MLRPQEPSTCQWLFNEPGDNKIYSLQMQFELQIIQIMKVDTDLVATPACQSVELDS